MAAATGGEMDEYGHQPSAHISGPGRRSAMRPAITPMPESTSARWMPSARVLSGDAGAGHGAFYGDVLPAAAPIYAT